MNYIKISNQNVFFYPYISSKGSWNISTSTMYWTVRSKKLIFNNRPQNLTNSNKTPPISQAPTLATFLCSIWPVEGHCISVQLIGTIVAPTQVNSVGLGLSKNEQTTVQYSTLYTSAIWMLEMKRKKLTMGIIKSENIRTSCTFCRNNTEFIFCSW